MSCSPPPRLCCLRKSLDFVEYGFNLHTEKNGNNYIREVDNDSPASNAGLKIYDRIIEVNGTNVANENHGQVVERMKSRNNKCELLVVCKDADSYLRSQKRTVKHSDQCVLRLPINDDDSNKSDIDTDPNPPRICVLRLLDDKVYGFILHWDQDREGQYIKEIDENSPATNGGLRKGDKVIEVNEKSIQGKTHNEVIDMMKEKPGVVKLLVVDTESAKVYRRQSIAISSSLQNVVHMPSIDIDNKDDKVEDQDVSVLPETTIEVNNNEEYEVEKEEVNRYSQEITPVEVVTLNSEPAQEDNEYTPFEIPVIVKGVTTTVDLNEEERKKIDEEYNNKEEEVKSEVEDEEVKSEIEEVKSEDEEVKPIVVEVTSEIVDEEVKPVDEEVKPVEVEVKSEDEVEEVKPVVVEVTSEIVDEEVKPVEVEVKSEDEVEEVKPVELEVKSEDEVEEVKPVVVEVKSEDEDEEVKQVIPIVNIETVDEVDEQTSQIEENANQGNGHEYKDQETGETVLYPNYEVENLEESTPVEEVKVNGVSEDKPVEEVKVNGVSEDKPVDDSSIEPVKRTVSRYDSSPTTPGSFSMSRTSAPIPVEDAEPSIFSMSVAEARKKLVGAKKAKDVRSLNLTASDKCKMMKQL